jgi:hypothetical protein
MRNHIPIRCCCTPSLVLGLMPYPEGRAPRDGQEIVYPFETRKATPWYTAHQNDPEIKTISFKVRRFDDHPNRTSELALHSNETPLDVLRTISGFVEINRPIPAGIL